MLPRLQAEEQLDAVRTGALAAGSYERDTQREMFDRLHKAAAGGARRRGARPKPRQLENMGIGMVVMPADGPSGASQEGVSHG